MVVIGTALSFIGSRAGMVAIALVVGFLVGHNAASNGQAVKRLNAEVLALEAELSVFRAAAEAAEQEAAQLRALQERLQEQIDDYETALEGRGEDRACRLDDADIERLRKLQ